MFSNNIFKLLFTKLEFKAKLERQEKEKAKTEKKQKALEQKRALSKFYDYEISSIYVRKGLEAYFTVLIELIWGKERIMEVYLNSIEMGDGVYGAQAAAKHWYRKEAKNLSIYEAAGIAAILPSPRKYKASNSGPYVQRRKGIISKYASYVKLEY